MNQNWPKISGSYRLCSHLIWALDTDYTLTEFSSLRVSLLHVELIK